MTKQRDGSGQQAAARTDSTGSPDLAASRSDTARSAQQDIERLTGLLDELELSTRAVFHSYTWRTGRALTWPLRKLGILSPTSAADHIDTLFRDYHAWRKVYAPSPVSSPPESTPAKAGFVTTFFRLLNRNNLRLLGPALRDLPRTGIRGFTRRLYLFIDNHRTRPGATETVSLEQALACLRRPPDTFELPVLDPPVDIIVPVYNGSDYLRALLPGLLNNTRPPYRLILVDDASTDPEVTAYLDGFAARNPHVLLLRAAHNQGFVRSVNWAFEQVRNHCVILNQDTEVPTGWLPRLLQPLLDDPGVATATPYTNAGTICSFPHFPEDSGLFADLDVERLDACSFRWIDTRTTGYPELPTGIGFCMAISKPALDQVGRFDADTFGRGYGEENDWCRRAVAQGYRNVMVPNLFVYHKHGGSFTSAEKQRLIYENLLKLDRRYPNYHRTVQEFIQRDPLRSIRELMIVLASLREAATRNRLVIDHGMGGGANSYLEERLKSWREAGEAVLLMRYDFTRRSHLLGFRFREWTLSYTLNHDPAKELQALSQIIGLDIIEVNNLVSFPDVPAMLSLLQALRGSDTRLNYYLHDYQSVCPAYTLLDHRERYCGVPEDLAECRHCLARNQGEFRMFYPKLPDIRNWRRSWGEFLKGTDRIVCFSNASASILRKAYPDLRDNVEIRPHRTPPLPARTVSPPRDKSVLRIGVLGAINVQKGINIIKAMADRIERELLPVQIVIIGPTSEPLQSPVITVTGRYQREQLPQLVEKHGIHVFLLPSIWPETYLFAADEVMMMDMPLAVFDLGAPAERVRPYRKGLIIDSTHPDTALNRVIEHARMY